MPAGELAANLVAPGGDATRPPPAVAARAIGSARSAAALERIAAIPMPRRVRPARRSTLGPRRPSPLPIAPERGRRSLLGLPRPRCRAALRARRPRSSSGPARCGLAAEAVEHLRGPVPAAQPEREPGGQCERADDAHEQRVDQRRGDAELVHRDDDGERPHRDPGDGGQHVRVAKPGLGRRAPEPAGRARWRRARRSPAPREPRPGWAARAGAAAARRTPPAGRACRRPPPG